MDTQEIVKRVARYVLSRNEVSPLDGMRKQKAKKIVNDLISKAAGTGLYSDEYWKGVKNVWSALDRAGIPYVVLKSEYQKDRRDVMPSSKRWEFEVPFVNERGRDQLLYGFVIAGGGGSVDDPLDKYDVTAYVD